MSKKRRGFTLIETMIAISLMMILLGISMPLIVKSYSQYKNILSDNSSRTYLDDALITIESLLKGYMISDIRVIEDLPNKKGEICITNAKEYDDTGVLKKKIIKFEEKNRRVILETITLLNNSIISSGKNVILLDVENFQIKKKENLYYFKINMDSGEERIQCI